jgi:prepilin-type processing-associated H-X9-DG protein
MNENLHRSPSSADISARPTQRQRAAVALVALLVVVGIIGIFVFVMLLPSVRTPREPSRRNVCMNNLNQIALALKQYEKVHGALPPAYTTDANGKPLHSWRTLILPFIEYQKLYESIDLTKPWDDPANAEARKASLFVYQCPSADIDDHLTTYLAVVTSSSCLRATKPRNLSDITDRAAQTLIVIEVDADHAVPWMSPNDADENLALGLGGPESPPPHPAGMNAAFVDGHVDFLPAEMSADQRRALISIAGNDNAALEAAE